MRSFASIVALHAAVAVTGVVLGASALTACFDDDPPPPAHTGGSTVVVSHPGVTAPQATVVQQPAPPVVNNVVEQPAAPQPAVTVQEPAPPTTVNVQPRTVTVP
jgi:hypothetical protein